MIMFSYGGVCNLENSVKSLNFELGLDLYVVYHSMYYYGAVSFNCYYCCVHKNELTDEQTDGRTDNRKNYVWHKNIGE